MDGVRQIIDRRLLLFAGVNMLLVHSEVRKEGREGEREGGSSCKHEKRLSFIPSFLPSSPFF